MLSLIFPGIRHKRVYLQLTGMAIIMVPGSSEAHFGEKHIDVISAKFLGS